MIKVGVIHSTSGHMGWSERPLINAALMAIAEINASGGLLGRQIDPVIHETDSTPESFAAGARKLLKDGVCSIFGCYTSESRIAVRDVLEEQAQEGKPNLLWYPVQYEGYEKSQFIIYTGPTANQQIMAAVRWWCLHRKPQNILLLGSNYVFPKVANELIEAVVNAFDFKPKFVKDTKNQDDNFYKPLGATDFNSVVDVIKEQMPAGERNVIFNTINGDSNLSFFRQLLDKEVTSDRVPVMSFSLPESRISSIGTRAMAGHFIACSYFNCIDSKANKHFVQDYEKRYPRQRITDDATEAAYFQVHLFAEAVRGAGSDDPMDIRKAALDPNDPLDYDAPSGKVKIDPDTQHCWRTSRIGEINHEGKISLNDIVWSSGDPMYPLPYPWGVKMGGLEAKYQIKPEPLRSVELDPMELGEVSDQEGPVEEPETVEFSTTGM